MEMSELDGMMYIKKVCNHCHDQVLVPIALGLLVTYI